MEEEKEVMNRSELLFLYDIKNANPNGDPDENKPRIDEETGKNIVTDVRLKRTIRDYLHDFKSAKVWIIKEEKQDGSIKSREEKLNDENMESRSDGKNLLKKYIDLRMFGATIAAKKRVGENVFTWIGPVQFRFGSSLHKVEPVLIRGTTVLPSEKNKSQGTFTEVYIVPYSLICFYGVINENAAKETGLTEKDVKLLLEGMWNGTKNLITRSKVGQMPRFLLRVVYKKRNFHIGDLDQKIKLLDENNKEVDKDGKEGTKIRSISEVKLNITDLITTLKLYKEKIEKIEYEVNDDVSFVVNDSEVKGDKIKDKLKEVTDNIERLKFELPEHS